MNLVFSFDSLCIAFLLAATYLILLMGCYFFFYFRWQEMCPKPRESEKKIDIRAIAITSLPKNRSKTTTKVNIP